MFQHSPTFDFKMQQEDTDYYFTTHLYNNYPNIQTFWSLDSRKFCIDIYLPSPEPTGEKIFNRELSNCLKFLKQQPTNIYFLTCKRESP